MPSNRRRYTPCPATTRAPVGRRPLVTLTCTLPAGHQSREHYDSMLSRVWLHPADAHPAVRPTPTREP